jgi:hypothetical protein
LERLGKASSREIGGIFKRFLHFLGHAHHCRGIPLGRLASEVLGLNKARVRSALRQELPGDSSHQTGRGEDGNVGSFAKGSLVFVKVPEVGRATNGNPGGLDEGPAEPFVAMS